LSCIPGTIGGGIRMNSGCFGSEFKDILISVQAINRSGEVLTIPAKDIIFDYRSSNLPKDLIFLSATFKGNKKKKEQIEKEVKNLKIKKEKAQPTKIKTGGSTFKNPIKQSDKKVWEIIKESIPSDIQFGDAIISDKHANFFINKGNASYKDMKKLIDFVKESVKNKTGINLDLEIILVE
jgi:UDP-N-acetylmuramate dehydrogenase